MKIGYIVSLVSVMLLNPFNGYAILLDQDVTDEVNFLDELSNDVKKAYFEYPDQLTILYSYSKLFEEGSLSEEQIYFVPTTNDEGDHLYFEAYDNNDFYLGEVDYNPHA